MWQLPSRGAPIIHRVPLRRRRLQLRGLLIKVLAMLAQLDSEEGLHAGAQVEGFTGPARPGGFGVGMLKAIHHS
jgi:hypothetical protein